jgi:general secretion pathway protein M
MADFSSLTNSWNTLSQRERRLVSVGGTVAVIFAVFMVTFSFSQKAASIRRTTTLKSGKLEDVLTLASGYGAQRAKQENLERQLSASNVRLISFLEEKAKAASIELPTINPKPDVSLDGTKIVESAVEVTLSDVKLQRLVEFLTSLEQGPGIVKVKYLRLEPRPANENLTAWVTIATYRTKG